MIPVEYFWGILFIVFGIIGVVRGLLKEIGATTILLLSLFALKFGWEQIGAKILESVQERAPGAQDATVEAIYYGAIILFVAFISYEGVVLEFPMKKLTGPVKGLIGLPGGLVNGYLVVGTIWDVVNKANYFGLEVPFGSEMIEITSKLTPLHNSVVQYLPVTFMNEFVMLVLGVILLLAIVLK